MFTIIPRGSINIKWWIRRQAETQHDESPCKSYFFDLQGLSYVLTLQWTIPPDESLSSVSHKILCGLSDILLTCLSDSSPIILHLCTSAAAVGLCSSLLKSMKLK